MDGIEARRKIIQKCDPSVPKKKSVEKFKRVLEQISDCRLRDNKTYSEEKMEQLYSVLLGLRRNT